MSSRRLVVSRVLVVSCALSATGLLLAGSGFASPRRGRRRLSADDRRRRRLGTGARENPPRQRRHPVHRVAGPVG